VGTVSPIFFENTINSECFIDMVHDFLEHFTEEQIAEVWFQEDNTTRHTARVVMRELSQWFGDRIISQSLWTTCSLDVTAMFFRNEPH
jgi:hypothetical protein